MAHPVRNHVPATIMLVVATAIAIPALWLTPSETMAQSAEVSRHCVQSLTKPKAQTACYDTFTDAIRAATGGQITDAPADVRTAVNDQRLLERLRPTGETKNDDIQPRGVERVIAILHSGANFGGSSLTYSADGDCTGSLFDIDFAEPYVGDEWNDEAESIKTFANCRTRLFEHRDFTGAMIDFAGDRTDFGILADKVSSLQWS